MSYFENKITFPYDHSINSFDTDPELLQEN